MKKLIAVLIVLCLVLIAATGIMIGKIFELERTAMEAPVTVPTAPAETLPVPTTEATEPPTEPAPVYYNPLNGELLDAPYTGRIFACTVSNIRDALPHVGVNDADILFESFVNGSIVRCLALFTDVTKAPAIGSVRSTRLMFNDIAQHYDAVLNHASGYWSVLADASERGLDHVNLDDWNIASTGASYRDKVYRRGHEHSLFGVGQGMYDYAASQGFRLTQPEDKDYCLVFAEDGTPAEGEGAREISVTITFNRYRKETIMKYSEELGKYVYWQYGKEMTDQMTNAPECFENVIVMLADVWANGSFQVTEFVDGGEGYYACGGKLIPITWHCSGDSSPFGFSTLDGEPLVMGAGNTYIAITQNGSQVTWTDVSAES